MNKVTCISQGKDIVESFKASNLESLMFQTKGWVSTKAGKRCLTARHLSLQMAEGFKRDSPLCMIPTEEIARMIRICRSGGQFTLTDEEIQRFRNNGRFAVGAFAGLSDEQVREKITRNIEKFFRIIVEKNPQMFKPEEARKA